MTEKNFIASPNGNKLTEHPRKIYSNATTSLNYLGILEASTHNTNNRKGNPSEEIIYVILTYAQ